MTLVALAPWIDVAIVSATLVASAFFIMNRYRKPHAGVCDKACGGCPLKKMPGRVQLGPCKTTRRKNH